MALSLANFERFNGKEDWTEYMEGFQQFLIANKIYEGERKWARNTYHLNKLSILPLQVFVMKFLN